MKRTRWIQLAAAACLSAAALAGAGVEFRRAGPQIEITFDGKPFTTYYFNPEVAKPYLMPLRTASGDIVSRPFPVGNDVSMANPRGPSFEPHQRPLYFGHGDVDGLDFWEEPAFAQYVDDHPRQPYGHMVLKSIEEAAQQGETVRVRARYTLNDPNNRIVGEETQTLVFAGGPQTRTIDCTFILYATAGPMDFGDTKEGTFGVRLGPALSAPAVHMTNSQGGQGEREIWGKPADWVDYSGTISGKPVGVAVLDHPKSFRHPTTWHARGYGLLSANPFGIREFTRDPNRDGAWTVPEGKSVTFRYRVLIHEGEFPAARIQEEYQRFAAEN